MAEKEEYDLEQESEERINRSTIDVEGFCHEHIVCKRCNNVCVDPVVLKCLHTYCLKCLPKGQNDNEEEEEQDGGGEGEGEGGGEEGEEGEGGVRVVEVVLEEDDGQADSGEGQAQQRQGISRDDEEAEIQSHHSDDDNDVRKKEASVPEEEESCVPHSIVYGNEDLSCPHDCAHDAGVQVNQPLSNIIRAAKLKEKLPQGQVKCGNCEEDTAKWICNDPKCGNMPLCEICYRAHIRSKQARDHQVVEVDPEKDWWRNLNRHTWHCSKHPDYLVDMYCPHHDIVMCHKCCTIEHRGSSCTVSDVHESYNGTLDDRLERLQKVEKLNDRFKAALRSGETIKRNLDTKRDDAIKVVNDRYQCLMEQLTNERDEAIAKANSICDLKKKEIDDHQETLKRVTETLEESLSFVKDYSEIANPTEYMFLKTQLNQRLDDLHEHYSKFDLSPADDDGLLLKLSNEDLPPMLGEVYSTPCVKMFKYDCHQDSAVIIVKCYDISGGHVSLHVLPELKAVITTRNGSIADGIKCKVKPDRNKGQYKIFVSSFQGEGTLHTFQPRPYPHNQYYIQGGPLHVYFT